MSGPYRFQGESAKSPLERSSSPFSAGQPVSFKTNVHRAKTKKWVTAKKNAYDGDDWGEYDEYDEYGVEGEPAATPAAPSQRYYRAHTDRSFTEPAPHGPLAKARRNSFEAGEEHRAFSASMPPVSSPTPPPGSPPDPHRFRAVVHHAFTPTDDQRSMPPTPVSKDDGESSVSRTNTASTTGISPIMSRVPSGPASAIKRIPAGGDGSTPAIAEEPSDTAASVPAATCTPAHSRNISASSLPRSGLATPTRGDSPARSPVVAPQRDLPEPTAAQIATHSPDEPHAMEGGLGGPSRPSPAYAAREADLAMAAKTSPVRESSALTMAEQRAQDEFLQLHAGQSPIEQGLPRSRSESPSKGRVQALAGKFGHVPHSRRGSTQSNISRNSMQSWERSQHGSRAPSPTKGSPSKPSSPAKEFRPHLPGQWESYTTTAATPLDQTERDRSLHLEKDKASNSLESAEPTPTTARHHVDEADPEDGISPIAALKTAGAAMAQSFKESTSSGPHDEQSMHIKGPSHGDMYMPRPLQLERAASSLSSIPPTPPAKDTPRNEVPPQTSAMNPGASTSQQKRPDFFPQLSTQPSADDQESDRLRKEIVASLTPMASTDANRLSLQPASPEANRVSSILPAEYDSYWADAGSGISPQTSQDDEHAAPAPLSTGVASVAAPTEELPKASLLHRFSWENNAPALAPPINLAETTTVLEPAKMSHQDSEPSSAAEHAVEELQSSQSSPEPNSEAGHDTAVTKPEPVTEPEASAQSLTVPVDTSSPDSLTREQTRSPGLHVVNSAVDPEAVDLPPRLGADIAAQEHNQDDLKPLPHDIDGEKPNPAVSASVSVPEPQTPTHATTHAHSAISPTSGKPLGTREIATISSAAERIATYNQTREQWATQDHGLGGWLVSTLEANPDLAVQTIPFQRAPTGTVRHKHAASLSLLGKLASSSTHQLGNEQNPSTPTQSPVGANSPNSGMPGSSATFDRRNASRQLETKGKDLLHTANVLSGKGLTSAKGLFAKGKSRFGREKVEK